MSEDKVMSTTLPAPAAISNGRDTCFSEFFQQVESLRNLPSSWDSYGAEPPNETALHWAQVALEIPADVNFPPTKIAPSVEEGVAICFVSGNKYADVECFNSGEVLAVISDGQGNPPEGRCSNGINIIGRQTA